MKARVKKTLGLVFGIPTERVPDNASMDNTESWDSIKHMSLILSLEQEFGVKFTEESIGEMLSLPLILAVLKEHGVC
jgi:acyl carrier protein